MFYDIPVQQSQWKGRAVLDIKGVSYKSVFFDFDGVVADTNSLKHRNIHASVSGHLGPLSAAEFVSFFTANNGIPREHKIYSWFDSRTGQAILQEYARRNRESFTRVGTTPGFARFFQRCCDAGARTWVLSGGDAGEIEAILRRNKLDRFDGILAGPASKSENLERLAYQKPAVFFGDSRHDYEVALEFGLGFIFMSGYTQFREWPVYFKNKPIIGIISSFTELL